MESEFQKNTFPYLDLLYNFALRITGSEKNAEKLLLETYLRAFRFYNHLDENTDYKSWMFRVIKKAYEDIYEKSENYGEVKNVSEISEVFSSLPEELKTVIILSDIENFTDEEIVAFTDCPLPVVEERLKEGRKILFKNFNRDSREMQGGEIQSYIKKLIEKELKIEPTPGKVKKKILKKIR
jgi:RNA polymerase sigma-70 factor, ECF subfamily